MSEFREDITAVRKVQEGDGCLTVTIPKDGARDLGIEPEDCLIFTGREGESIFRTGKPDTLLSQDFSRQAIER